MFYLETSISLPVSLFHPLFPPDLWTSVEMMLVPVDHWRWHTHTHTHTSANPWLHFIYSSLLLVSLQKISKANRGCRWNFLHIYLDAHTHTNTHTDTRTHICTCMHRHESTVTINIWPCPRAFSNMNFKHMPSSPRPKWPPSDTLQNYSSHCGITVASSQNIAWVT